MNKSMNIKSRIKEYTTRKFALLIILLSLAFSGTFGQVIGQNDTIVIDRILAVVGSHAILQSDVENTYQQSIIEGRQLPGDAKCGILEGLMQSKLILDQAELDSVEVSDKEVETALNRKLAAFVQQAGSEKAIEDYFRMSMAEIKKDFFPDVKEQLLTERMTAELTTDVRITPSAVQKFYKNINEDEAPRIPEQIEIRQIVLKPVISDEERKRVIDQLNDYREQILAGKSMATIAILNSEDEGSRSLGGALGYKRRSELVPEFTAVAFNLRGDEVSRVVKTEFGYHLIQVIDRKGESINARHILLRPKVSEEGKRATKSRLDSIVQSIRAGEIEFNQAALKYSTDEATFANGGLMINYMNGSTKFEPKDIPPRMLVEINKLKIGEYSDPFESQDNNMNTVFKIITIKSRLEAHQIDIKTDYQYIQQMALMEENAKALNKWLEGKQKSTFIRVHQDYQGCEFNLPGWVK